MLYIFSNIVCTRVRAYVRPYPHRNAYVGLQIYAAH